MTIAVMSQVDAALLPKAERRWLRRQDPAVPEQTGKALWSTPLHALVEARMRKTLIEIECQARSHGTWSKDPGKGWRPHRIAPLTRIAAQLSSVVRSLTSLLSAPALKSASVARAAVLPNALRAPLPAAASATQASRPSQAYRVRRQRRLDPTDASLGED